MHITLVQSALAWESPDANRRMFAEKLAPLAGATDLVVLPEMFTTGFSMNAAALAEPMDGPTVGWLREQAARLNAAVTGSFICRGDDGRNYNRLVWAFPDGRLATYDKHNLFALAGEHDQYSPGVERVVVEWKGFRVLPLICYDLRFPEWARNRGAAYDLLVYVANWPVARAHHWRSLLAARAIENQAYVAGVNRVGSDGTGLEYNGDTSLIDYAGNAVCQLSGQEGIFTGVLAREPLDAYRRQLPFLAGV